MRKVIIRKFFIIFILCIFTNTLTFAEEKIEYIHFEADFNDNTWHGISYGNFDGAEILPYNKDEADNYAVVRLPKTVGLRVERTLDYAISGEFSLEADFKLSDEAKSSENKSRRNLLQLLNSNGDYFTPIGVMQGYLRNAHGRNIFKYEQNRWYNIKVVMHFSKNQLENYYDIYIDGKKVSNDMSGEYLYNNINNHKLEDVSKIRFMDCWSNISYTSESAIDNIKLSQLVDSDYKIPPTRPRVEKAIPLDDSIKERYPVFQAAVNKISGHTRGFGMLAEYGNGGPKSIYVRRITAIPEIKEPINSICYAKVFDPDGMVAAYIDLTTDSQAVIDKVIKVAYGKAGIWRVAINGGRDGDRLEIGLPQTDIWGVRGEMTLGLTETTPKTSYIYLAHTTAPEKREDWTRMVLPSGYLLLERYSINGYGDAPEVNIYNEKGEFAGKPEQNDSRNIVMIENTPKDKVWKIDINGYGGAIAIDGVPGLLCPTEEAAKRLKGGTVEQDGFVLAGPMQARARREMVRIAKEHDLNVDVTFLEEIPEGADVYTGAMLYCKQSPLSSIGYSLDDQVLDVNDHYFGRVIRHLDDDSIDIQSNRYSTNGFANAVSIKSELNPYYKNPAMIQRAILSGLSYLVFVQGDDIFRIDDYRNVPYPYSDLFFVYAPEISEPYSMLEKYMTEETKTIWKHMAAAVGDKAADFKCYHSNQWSHMIWGHLMTYIATKEERFLRLFEEHIQAFLGNTHGANDKYGLHEGGYFLEEFGPDGNYQSLNLYAVVNAYYNYKDLSEADPKVLEYIKTRINDALTFNSYYWLLQPNGIFEGPTHMNARTKASFSVPNYPADHMARADFSLGYTRWLLNREDKVYAPGEGGYIGGYNANNEEWARNVINAWLPFKDRMFDSTSFVFLFGGLFEAFERSITVEPVKIPTDYENGTWNVAGQTAWKRQKLYGMIFYDVAGSTRNIPASLFGGGPSVFWTEGTGNILVSHSNTKSGNKVENKDDLTFSCIYGEKQNDNLFYSGKEHWDFEWLKKDESFKVSSVLKEVDAEISWQYDISDNKTDITVSLKSKEPLKEAYVNLPLNAALKNTVISQAGATSTIFENGGNEALITYPEGSFFEITEALKTGRTDVKCLRLKIPADGSPMKITISAK